MLTIRHTIENFEYIANCASSEIHVKRASRESREAQLSFYYYSKNVLGWLVPQGPLF